MLTLGICGGKMQSQSKFKPEGACFLNPRQLHMHCSLVFAQFCQYDPFIKVGFKFLLAPFVS